MRSIRVFTKKHAIVVHDKSLHIKTCLWELSSIVINFKFLHNIKFYSYNDALTQLKIIYATHLQP